MKHLVAIFLASTAFGAYAQEFRDTAVPNSQIKAIVRDVAEWHDMQHPGCTFVRATGSKLVEKNADSTVEHWSIEACSGKVFTYRVMVMPQSDGGVSDSVSNVDGSSVGEPETMSAEQLTAECAADKKELEQMGQADKVPDDKIERYAQLSAQMAACQANGSAP